jgi:predicted aconitase with swiveling domain
MNRTGQASVAGAAEGRALVLKEPLSFWGGVDVATGRIIDHSHPALGQCVTGMILVMPGGRGSSSSSSVLAEAIRRRTAPAALLLGRPDPILTVGALVARSLYGLECPIIACDVDGIVSGDWVRIAMTDDARASLSVTPRGGEALSENE